MRMARKEGAKSLAWKVGEHSSKRGFGGLYLKPTLQVKSVCKLQVFRERALRGGRAGQYRRTLPSLGGAFALFCLSVYLTRQISELAAAAAGGGGSESSGCSVLITKYTGEAGGAPGVGASQEKGLLPSASGTCTGAPHSWSALSRVQE